MRDAAKATDEAAAREWAANMWSLKKPSITTPPDKTYGDEGEARNSWVRQNIEQVMRVVCFERFLRHNIC